MVADPTMATKELILNRIREALADRKTSPLTMPAPPDVQSIEGISTDEKKSRFQQNLEAVKGEITLCDSFDQAVEKITALFDALDVKRVAVLERPLSRAVADRLSGKELVFASAEPADASPEALSIMDAGLVAPEYLLADTGSCLFAAPTAFDRLTTYITPISVVVAGESMLRENLGEAWKDMKPRLETATTGEFVIVTGPSRTADIEKILILGVHGPKRLLVFLIKD